MMVSHSGLLFLGHRVV